MFILKRAPETGTFSLTNNSIAIEGLQSRLQAICKIAQLIHEKRITGMNVIQLILAMREDDSIPPLSREEIGELEFPNHLTTIAARAEYVLNIISPYDLIMLTTGEHLIACEQYADQQFPLVYFFTDDNLTKARIYLAPLSYTYSKEPFEFNATVRITPDFITQEEGVAMILSFQESGKLDLLTAERLIHTIERSALIREPDSVEDN